MDRLHHSIAARPLNLDRVRDMAPIRYEADRSQGLWRALSLAVPVSCAMWFIASLAILRMVG